LTLENAALASKFVSKQRQDRVTKHPISGRIEV
jgi:hypothetical protein